MVHDSQSSNFAPPAPEDIYVEVMTLATRHQAINLAQGFPDDDTTAVADATADSLSTGSPQYAPLSGLPRLRTELARRGAARGLHYDPQDEITVTIGCTEATAAALYAVAPPGSDILTLAPFYDSYPGLARMVGARLVPVSLRGVDGTGAIDVDLAALRRATTPQTRVLLLNSPHNPTGFTLTEKSVQELAGFAIEHNLVVVSDEVYEEHVYDGEHARIAAQEGMRERTVVCSSASKMLSVGGWRIGWAYAPRELTALLQHHHRHLAFTAPTPLQEAVATGLRWADETGYFAGLRAEYRRRRDVLCAGLTDLGLTPRVPPGGFFVTADVTSWARGATLNDLARSLITQTGVAALPMGDFFEDPAEAGNTLRFAFCKPVPVLQEAVRRLAARR